MMFLTIVVALCITSFASSSPLTNRIINGTEAPSLPWMAAILTYYKRTPLPNGYSIAYSRNCGGSLVAPNWVLTARHCIYTEQNNLASSQFYVAVGSNDIVRGQVKRVIDIVVYNSDHEDDVILLQLDSNIQGIAPVQVQYDDNIHYAGLSATICGWGITETNHGVNNLRQATVQLISREDCGESRWVCFNPKATNTNMCGGDSGGPMYINENGEQILIGVVHAGVVWVPSQTPCDGPKSMLMSTAYYGNWIKSIIGEN